MNMRNVSFSNELYRLISEISFFGPENQYVELSTFFKNEKFTNKKALQNKVFSGVLYI